MTRLSQAWAGIDHQRADSDYYSQLPIALVTSTLATVADRLYAVPLLIPYGRTVDRIGIQVLTAQASSQARVGIYESGDDLYPSDLVVDGGAISTAATGIVTASISQSLPPALYWVALIDSHSSVGITAGSYGIPLLGHSSSAFATARTYWYVGDTFGALPDPFPGGGTKAGGDFPIFALRFSA